MGLATAMVLSWKSRVRTAVAGIIPGPRASNRPSGSWTASVGNTLFAHSLPGLNPLNSFALSFGDSQLTAASSGEQEEIGGSRGAGANQILDRCGV